MKNIFVAFAVVMLACSCSTSQSSLNSLRSVVNDARENGQDYTVKEWKKSSQKYYKADKKVLGYALKKSYTASELKEIGTLNADYVAACSSSASAASVNTALTVKGIYSGIMDRFKSSKDTYKDALKQIESIFGIGQ